MSDFITGMLSAVAVVIALFLAFGGGIEATKSTIADNCLSYGAVKISGKLYECKLK